MWTRRILVVAVLSAAELNLVANAAAQIRASLGGPEPVETIIQTKAVGQSTLPKAPKLKQGPLIIDDAILPVQGEKKSNGSFLPAPDEKKTADADQTPVLTAEDFIVGLAAPPRRRIPNMLGSYLGSTFIRARQFQVLQTITTTKTNTQTVDIIECVFTENSNDICEGMPLFKPVVVGQKTITTTTTDTQQILHTLESRIRMPAAGRGFRISVNQSPLPQDQIYGGFDFFDPINADFANRFGGLESIQAVYRSRIGFEKTFFDGTFSAGLQLPYNAMQIDSRVPGFAGTDSDIGDLTLVLKTLLMYNCETGSALSAGLAVTFPTGPSRFAGAVNGVTGDAHSFTFQPYVGYIWAPSPNWYVQGFAALDVPTESDDVTLAFIDTGVGYFLYHNPDRWLVAVIPTAEVLVTSPLNHRDYFDFFDRAGSADVVDLLGGVILQFSNNVSLAAGASVPVTGPQPFDLHAFARMSVIF